MTQTAMSQLKSASPLGTRAHVRRRFAEAELAIAEIVEDLVADLHNIIPPDVIDARLRAIFTGLSGQEDAPLALPAPPPVAVPTSVAAPVSRPPTPKPTTPAAEPEHVKRAAPSTMDRLSRAMPKPAPKPVSLPTTGSAPLSEDEEGEALERDARGEGAKEIAAALGRSAQGFHHTLARLRREAEAEADAEEGDGGADREGIIPGIWTPAKDLRLVELLVAGEGVPAVVEQLGVERAVAIARWNRLCPTKTVEAQTKLLKDLRGRVAK